MRYTDVFATTTKPSDAIYDPESLITGEEIARGFTYDNSTRNYAGPYSYKQATRGVWTPEQVAEQFPRVANKGATIDRTL